MDSGDKDDKTPVNSKEEAEENSSKLKARNRGKKRKRQTSGSSSEYEELLPENALQMERNLHASAVKNNLDETSVRKILKKVVTNDHVLALVKLREEAEKNEPEGNSLRPKLTRAKVKELMKVSPKTGTWNLENLDLTPIKQIPVKTRPEVKALIAQELPDDEDDDEYEPTNDDVPSDDDQGLESCSDLDSQPRTPATPHSTHTASPQVVKDGPFKVPQDISTPTRRKLNLEEATIALRTRSKLSLSATSIEHIESTFVPPDDLPMPAVDDLWNQFLNECLNPASTSKHEDDDETDPEYNVAADADAHDEDEEALSNSIIKISKKELNDLVTELFNIMPEPIGEDVLMAETLSNSVLTDRSQAEISSRWEGKQEPVSDDEKRERISDRLTFEKRNYTRSSIGKTEPSDTPDEDEDENEITKQSRCRSRLFQLDILEKQKRSVDITIEEQEKDELVSGDGPPAILLHRQRAKKTQSVTIEVDKGPVIHPDQVLILEQQLRQHIQLATTNFMQLYTHPIHWHMAPTFKEYLETLEKLGTSNSSSVVNVCNLKPSLDIVKMWEKTVSVNNPENKEMVDFVLKQAERCRRRVASKSYYVGDFHEMFMTVVANSSVFLYPYLLPDMPYRPDHIKRYYYTRSEDELIALGLDQFWDYVESNPSIYKPRKPNHPRHRWGLAVTMQLMVKHMFPWIQYKGMLAHVQFVRRLNDKDNPICKFFDSRTVTPVKHTLLPFNPKITLYEQPEHEVPRIWVRYLAKTSKRFKSHLNQRKNVTAVKPSGVEINMGQNLPDIIKPPLPIDFTKEIISNRINLRPKTTQANLADTFDIHVAKPMVETTQVVTNLFKLVETSTGAYLMPLSNLTNTVNTNTSPIPTPAVVTSNIIVDNHPESSKSVKIENDSKTHCTCCILLRKISKERQTSIKDYFCLNKPQNTCHCKDISYPKVTKRLKLLVNNYKNNSIITLQCLEAKLKRLRENKDCISLGLNDMDDIEFDLNDFVFVTSFHLKLLTRMTAARDTLIKKRVHTLLSKFNPSINDPLILTNKLSEAFKVELVDMYKEFLCFLTPEQADKCDAFRDYFLRNCLDDLIKKIEFQVQQRELRLKLLRKLHSIFFNNLLSACEICTDILSMLNGYPKLALYVFSLFPHRKEIRTETKEATPPSSSGDRVEDLKSVRQNDTLCDQSHATMDYEADHSSSSNDEENDITDCDENDPPPVIKDEITTTEVQIRNVNFVSNDSNLPQDSCDSSNHSMTIDEDVPKEEAIEWRREEDKLILEVLKQHLSPEERKDRTLIEIIEEKNIIEMIADSLTDKTNDDITKRVLYLIELLWSVWSDLYK